MMYSYIRSYRPLCTQQPQFHCNYSRHENFGTFVKASETLNLHQANYSGQHKRATEHAFLQSRGSLHDCIT